MAETRERVPDVRRVFSRTRVKMAFPDRRTVEVLLTALLFAAVCAAIYSARRIILVFVFAILFAYLIDPVVKFLQKHSLFFRNLRGPAVVEVYLAFVLLVALLGHTFAPGLVKNTAKTLDEIPTLLEGLSTGNIADQLGGKYGWSEEQELRFRDFLGRHREDIHGMVQHVDRFLSNAARVLGWLLLIPILAVFFLLNGEQLADAFIQTAFSANRRAVVRATAKELHIMLTRYIRAQIALCAFSFMFYSAAMLLLKFPHAIALGLLGGLLEFIPAAGWMTTFAVITGVGAVNHSHWISMAVLLGIWRVIQDYVLSPRILGRQLEIHPLAAIFAVLVGAQIGGVVGIYLAIPLMASVRVIWRVCADPDREEASDYSRPDAVAETQSGLAETATT